MPTAEDVVAIAESLIGTDEEPDGSNNAPPVTSWYYDFRAAWCVMFDSYVMAHAGFSDDAGETLNVGARLSQAQTTAKGWSFCGYMREAFEAAGRWDEIPRRGSFFILPGDVHTGLVTDPGNGGTIEGNYGNHCVRGGRDWSRVAGFCHPPYDGAPGPTPGPVGPRTLRRGTSGDDVGEWQTQLNSVAGAGLDVDGDFGPATEAATIAFQQGAGIEADGIVGPQTRQAMASASGGTPLPTPPPPPPAPSPGPDVPPFPGTTRRGSRGMAVRQVQQRLVERTYDIAVDGDFGPATDAAVRDHQRDKGLEVDGIVGPITWTSLWASPIT